jgi:hypothetical protein
MRRWSGVAGIVFVVLAIVSRAVALGLPDSRSRDALARFTTFYADRSHNTHALFGVVAGLMGLFAFAWFLAGVWRVLCDAEAARPSRQSSWPSAAPPTSPWG